MNPRLKKETSGDPSFHIGHQNCDANTKGQVYLYEGTLVKPLFE